MRKCILLSFILFSLKLTAQTPVFKNFTTDDGLPTNEVYYAFQDKDGFIWFCTDDGVSKYDGKTFINYTTNDGLAENTTLNVQEDSKGRLWFGSVSGKLTIYENNQFKPYINNDTLSKVLAQSPMRSWVIDKNDNIWFSGSIGYSQGYYWLYDSIGLHKIDVDSLLIKNKMYCRFFYKEIEGNKYIYGATRPTDPKVVTQIDSTVSILDNYSTSKVDGLYFYNTNLLHNSTQHGTRLKRNNSYIFSNGYQITFIKDNSSVNTLYTFPYMISYFYEDRNNNIWVGTENGGTYYYEGTNFNKLKTNILKGLTVTSITEDHENGIWFSTSENGVFYYPNFNYKTIKLNSTLNSDKLNECVIYNNCLYLGTEKGKLICIDSTLNINYLFNTKNSKSFHQLQNYNDRLILTANEGFYKLDKNHPLKPLNVYDKDDNSTLIKKCIYFIDDKNYLIGLNTGLFDSHNGTANNFKSKVSAIEKYTLNEFLIGSNDGLYIYNRKEHTIRPFNNSLGKSSIKTIQRDSKGNYYVATDGDGVSIITSDTTFNIREQDGLASNIIEALFIDKNKLLIGTSQGLAQVSFKNGFSNFMIINLSKKHGLLENSIKAITKVWSKYCIVSEKGITFIQEHDELINLNAPKLTINQLIGGIDTLNPFNSGYLLKASNNNIKLTFTGINFKNDKLSYLIYLDGFSKDTFRVYSNEYYFNNLSTGNYTLSLTAVNEHGIKSDPYLFTFGVDKHYTETWWFISLMVLAGILAISSIFLLIIRNLNKRSALQRNLLITEQKALRAQMNPHFTFNALNSIQYFLTDNDKLSATTFLSKFSMLVRKILYNSNNNLITLEEEITTLKLYLDLEELRFGDKLNIAINVDDSVPTEEILVPSMIIQPFLENAIWHGIMPKESGKGNLTLNFKMDEKKLVCIIRDDGIGREKSAELKAIQRKGHKSTGLKNIEDRISVLNHINPNNKISLNINDIKNTNNKVTGTEVIIIFDQGEH